MSNEFKVIVILGPTASGKSELAVKIAKKFNAEVISADSRQIYKELNIGAGKVPRDGNPKSEIRNSKQIQNSKFKIQNLPYFYKGIPHHLLDVASPKRTFTVAQYQKLAKKTLKDILRRGKIPIICGGTGFYIDALIYDYKLPEIPPQLKLRKRLEKKSNEELFRQLQKLDPRRAKNIDKNNRRRLIRALEIRQTIGRPISPLESGTMIHHSATIYNILKLGIKKSPEELKESIKKRLLRRLKPRTRINSVRGKIGMIEEVKKLHKQGLSWQRLDNFGLEYRYVSQYLRGLITEEKMIDLISKESWQYAKRQMTWFKRDRDIIWINNPQKVFAICRDFLGL